MSRMKTYWQLLQERGQAPEPTRKSARERGYDYAWEQTRARKLAADPLCEDCSERGDVTPATQVHHVHKLADRPDLKHDPENLMSLCVRCHAIRTARGE